MSEHIDRFARSLHRQLDERRSPTSGPPVSFCDVGRWCRIASAQFASRVPELSDDELRSHAGEAVFRAHTELNAGRIAPHAMNAYVTRVAANLANDQVRAIIRNRDQRVRERTLELGRSSVSAWRTEARTRDLCAIRDLASDVESLRTSGAWSPRMTTLDHLYRGRSFASMARQRQVPTSTISRRYHHDLRALRLLFDEGAS